MTTTEELDQEEAELKRLQAELQKVADMDADPTIPLHVRVRKGNQIIQQMCELKNRTIKRLRRDLNELQIENMDLRFQMQSQNWRRN